MADYLKAPGRDWPAHDPDVKRLFGLDPKAKWPNGGFHNRVVDGITCWVLPLESAPVFGLRLRARCFCPNCGKSMPIGRLAQHWRAVHRDKRLD